MSRTAGKPGDFLSGHDATQQPAEIGSQARASEPPEDQHPTTESQPSSNLNGAGEY